MSVVRWERPERTLRGEIRINGEEIYVVVGDGLVSFDEELTIDGSPIVRLSLLDPERFLLASGLFELNDRQPDKLAREVELVLDGVAYWLAGVSKQEDLFELTFEDRTVAMLRDRRGATKISASTIDHRSFVRRLVERVGARFVTGEPGRLEIEARKKAGIGVKTSSRLQQEREQRDERRAPGIADRPLRSAGVTVKDAPATPTQIGVMNQVLDEALRHDPPPLALLSLVAAIIVECDFYNKQGEGADRISWGVIQYIVGRTPGPDGRPATLDQARDVAWSVRGALTYPGPTSKGGLIRLAQENPGWSPGEIAARAINGGGDPDYVSKVNGRVQEATRIIEAYTGGELAHYSGYGTITRTTESPLTIERDESHWDAMRRIAGSYGFRCFAVSNAVYYIADEALMKSRPRMTLSESEPGVGWLNWEWMPRKIVRRTEVDCNVRAWRAPPGSVVLLDDDCGPAAGPWLVADYQRSRFDRTASISLVRGMLRPKVPTDTELQTIGSPSGLGSGGLVGYGQVSTDGGAIGIVDQVAAYAIEVGGGVPYVSSSHRPEDYDSDHGSNDSTRAARDIAVAGKNPTENNRFRIPELDRAAVAVAALFGRTYAEGETIDIGGDGIAYKGYRIQLFWRTSTGGNHWNHIHIGAAKL